MSIRETFSNSINLAVINHLTTFSESVFSEMQKLWRLSYFSKCSKFNLGFKTALKIERTFFVSEIIASELVSLDCLY